jgi:hypothetical protein
MYDFFNSKADNYDANSVTKALDTSMSIFNGKGYGIKLGCLEIDDE